MQLLDVVREFERLHPQGANARTLDQVRAELIEAKQKIGRSARHLREVIQNILDVALNQGLDLPYSCKGGVCVTCRCKVLEGEVAMDKNFGLDASEVQQGYVLSCQSRPLTSRLVVSFDER